MKPTHQPGLPQYLKYRRFLAPGIIELDDTALVTAFEVTGPDQEYADYMTMESLANHLNRDVAKLSSGWMLHVEAIRSAVVVEPGTTHCPEITSQLVAEERAAEYAAEGTHYGRRLVYFFVWLPPKEGGRWLSNLFFGTRRKGKISPRKALVLYFQQQTALMAEALGHFLKLKRLTNNQIKRCLYYCITGEDREIGNAPRGEMLNYALGAVEMEPYNGKMGKHHFRVVGAYGFSSESKKEEAGTYPQMLDDLLQLPFALRLSQRFIFLGSKKIVKELERTRNQWGYTNWFNPKRVGLDALKHVNKIDSTAEGAWRRSNDADNQVASVDRTITDIEAGAARGGYYTLVVILYDTDEERIEEHAAQVQQLLSKKGFQAVVETDNAPSSWRGSLPGHGKENVRRPRLTTDHFVRLMPTSTPWRGHEKHPSPLYPPNSGPLLICKSTGETPFRFTPQLHSLIIGPTEAGKTTLLNSMGLAQLQYERAQVFTFDYDAGGVVPCLATGGEVFDLGAMKYFPLSHIHLEDEYAWALDFCENLVAYRGYQMIPQARIDLRRALTDLSKNTMTDRTITKLLGQLQTSEAGLRDALEYYAGSQPGAILDGTYSETVDRPWLSFDMAELQKRSEAVRVPVLLAQLHTLDRRMNDGRPTRMTFEEGWRVAGDVLLRDFIETSSATMRKKVVAVDLVLHSPGDLSVFPHADRLLANVGTYIFLPNDNANTPAMRKHYSDLGLGSRVIRKLAEEMMPRRDYLVKEGNQQRIMRLPWGPVQRALLSVNGRDEKSGMLDLRQRYGDQFMPHWLRAKGHAQLAREWEQRNNKQETRHAA